MPFRYAAGRSVIRGRAVRRDTVTNVVTPVPNATLTVVDFWTTLAAIHAQVPGSMTDRTR